MCAPKRIFPLAPILFLLSPVDRRHISCRAELQWPYDLPPHVKYFPEHEHVVRRNLDAQDRLANQTPVGVRKMSHDEGEMFFLDYWAVPGSDQGQTTTEINEGKNSSINTPMGLPFLPHADGLPFLRPRFFPNALFKRDFACPSGTTSCSAIGRANSCCPDGQTCNIIPDTGLGDVGCCPDSSCSGGPTGCENGYTPCKGDQGGGCCVPGYACSGVGCVLTRTSIVVVQPTVTVGPSTSTSTTPSTTTSSTSSSTSTSTPSSSSTSSATPTPTPTPSTTRSPVATTCSPGFQSCPADQGGGCCPTDRACGPQTCPPLSASTSEIGPGIPARPTSAASTVVTSTTDEPTTITASACPTGFYQCGAFFNGGSCCQVGRDCGLTSCPPLESSSVLVSNGVTIFNAPTGTAPFGVQGNCANGWYSCASDIGGGCCLSGYVCGTSSCAATGSANASPSSVPKQNAAVEPRGRIPLLLALVPLLFGLGFDLG